MILRHAQTVHKRVPAMQSSAPTVRFLSWWQRDTGIYKACFAYMLNMSYVEEEWEKGDNILGKRIPLSTQVHFGVGQSGI